jgi:hypothetical protein
MKCLAARSSPWLARPTEQGEPPWLTPGSPSPLKAAGALAGANRARVHYSGGNSFIQGLRWTVLVRKLAEGHRGPPRVQPVTYLAASLKNSPDE